MVIWRGAAAIPRGTSTPGDGCELGAVAQAARGTAETVHEGRSVRHGTEADPRLRRLEPGAERALDGGRANIARAAGRRASSFAFAAEPPGSRAGDEDRAQLAEVWRSADMASAVGERRRPARRAWRSTARVVRPQAGRPPARARADEHDARRDRGRDLRARSPLRGAPCGARDAASRRLHLSCVPALAGRPRSASARRRDSIAPSARAVPRRPV